MSRMDLASLDLSRFFAGLGVVIFSLTTYASVPSDEKSPPVSDVLYAVKQMSGPSSIVVDEEIEGIYEHHSAGIKRDDHVQGMTMTADGRIVLSYSRTQSGDYCGGLLISSSRFDPDNPEKPLTWHMQCRLDSNATNTSGEIESHPSNIQAAGNIIAVGSHGGSRFFKLNNDGSFEFLRHLSIASGGRDASGLVYNHVEDRHYVINADGPVTPTPVSATICRSKQGKSLTDTNNNFNASRCKKITGYVSGQASNLIMQDDGEMYLVSLFSSDEYWPSEEAGGNWWNSTRYEAQCLIDTNAAVVGGYSVRTPYEDIIYVSKVDYSSGTMNVVYQENILRTQRAQACLQDRPAFRFSGAVASRDDYNGLIGFWSGRQNRPVGVQSDNYEFAFQKLSLTGNQSLAYKVDIDCHVDGLENEGTKNNITATFYDKNLVKLGSQTTSDISDRNCKFRWITLAATLPKPAEFVKISTDGSDGFMIDRIQLYKEGNKVKEYGLNNDKGWCFSTDDTDGSRSWKFAADGICVSYHTWSYSGAAVKNNPYDIAQANAGSKGKTNVRYRFDIDCDVQGTENEATTNTITAIMYDSKGKEIGRGSHTKDTTGVLGVCKDIEFDVITTGTASKYRLQTNGSNGALLDQIFLYKNGKKIHTKGASNNSGWCLSTDEKDAKGSWKQFAFKGVCQSHWDFNI